MLLNRLSFIGHFLALLVLLSFSVSEYILNTTVTWFWCFRCKTSSMLSYCYCPCAWRGAQTSCCYDHHICLGLESFPGCWLGHWPNTISADPEQIAEEPSHKTAQNTVFCGTKCKEGICLYVYSNCPQLHLATVWRMSKRGLLTITSHTLDVFCVLKCSFKHLFRGLETKNNIVF